MHSSQCRANHLGVWAVEPIWFRQAVASVQAGMWPANKQEQPSDKYSLIGNVAAILIQDFMMKGQSKYGGTSTVQTRLAIREANRDESVEAILLHIDSPGGHHFGTDELASEVRASRKPVVSYIEDTGASAAYWTAAAAGQGRVYANRTAEVGSIGTFAVLKDESRAVENEGVTVHVVSTGPLKGAGVPGTPITEGLLAEVREAVNRAFSFFADSVKSDRRMTDEQFAAVSDGRMFGASDAVTRGLIDGIATLDQVIQIAADAGRSMNAKGRASQLRRNMARVVLTK